MVLAWSKRGEGSPPQAEEHARRILAIDPEDGAGLNYAGDVALFQGHLEEGRKFYERAVDAGWTESAIAMKDPLMEGLWKNTKFLEVLAQADRRVGEMRHRVSESQKAGAGPSER